MDKFKLKIVNLSEIPNLVYSTNNRTGYNADFINPIIVKYNDFVDIKIKGISFNYDMLGRICIMETKLQAHINGDYILELADQDKIKRIVVDYLKDNISILKEEINKAKMKYDIDKCL